MTQIFIVDDNHLLLSYLEKQLQKAGNEVISCSSGLAAVKKLEDCRPAVIFIDYFLPNFNGDKLCRIIREFDHLKNAYIVVMSAAATELQLDISKIGANAIIAKESFKDTTRLCFEALENAASIAVGEAKETGQEFPAVSSRQMTKELLAKFRHLETMLDSISDGLIEIYHDQIVYVNPTAATLLGLPAEKLLTANPLTLFESDDQTRIKDLINAGNSAPSPINPEKPLHINDKFLAFKKLPFPGNSDTVILLVSDVTLQKAAEQKIRKYQDHLESLVEKRTAALKETTEQFWQAQKMESIGTLTGGIAHDFNNILGIIIGNTELALDDTPDSNSVYSNLTEIRAAGMRARDIVKQLLSFSQRTEQHLEPIEIVPVIREALKFLRSMIPSTIDIQQKIYCTDETILGDSTQIYQVIMNLCANASQEMEQSGGTITVMVETIHLDETTAPGYSDLKKGDYIKVSVKDTGGGIKAENIDKIFDPYFTTKEIGKGSGMGLAVIHGIVKNHKGAVSVESAPGQGAMFNILFPLIKTKSESITEIMTEIPTGTESILLVDDEKSIVRMTMRILERLGYQVEACTEPAKALTLFRSDPDRFDLVITDMTMPEMTGVALYKKITEIRSEIPIIICTGHSAMLDEEKAKTLGIAAYIMKPIDIGQLARTVRKVLDEQ